MTGEWHQARDWYRESEQKVAKAERELDKVKPWQRDKLQAARYRLHQEQHSREHLAARAKRLAEKYQELTTRPNQPKDWEHQHAADLARREQRVQELTQQREVLREHAIEHTLQEPPDRLTRVLGERPADLEQRQVWQDAAREIERYRHEYEIRDQRTALGQEPEGDWKRHEAFDKAKNKALDARERLGFHTRAHQFEPHPPAPDLSRPAPGHGRGHYRGMDLGR